MRRTRQEATLHGWIKALPTDVIRVRPVLSVGLAGALLASGEFEGVEARLLDAEGWLSPDDAGSANRRTEMVVANDEEFQRLPAAIQLYRAAGAHRARRRARHSCACPAGTRSVSSGRPPPSGGGIGHVGNRLLDNRQTSRQATARGRNVSQGSTAPATLPTRSVARSAWPTSGAYKVVSVTR